MNQLNIKIIMIALLGIGLLGGCSSKTDEIYQNAIQKGLDAVAEDNFSKAEGLFETALDAKKDDVKANAYLKQIQMVLKVDQLVEQDKIEDAIQLLDKSINVKDGSKVISAKSIDRIEELTTLQEKQKKVMAMLTDAKKFNESGDYQKSNETLDGLLKEDLNLFSATKEEALKLKSTNDESIKQAEMAKVEKEAQEKAATAKEPSINGITAEEAITLSKRLPSYSDLVANGDTFGQPEIYDGSWVINISRPNGLAEGAIIVDNNKTVSFMYPNGEIDEVTPYK